MDFFKYFSWMMIVIFFIIFIIWCIILIAYPVINAIQAKCKEKRKEKEFKKNEEERLVEAQRLKAEQEKKEQERLEEQKRKEEQRIEEQKKLEAYYQSDEYKEKVRQRKEQERIKAQKQQEAYKLALAKKKAEEDWLNGFTDLAIPDFFDLYEKNKQTITGVYIIHNNSKNKYYVGQATKIFDRVYNLFTGNGGNAGSKELFYDYVKTRDQFTVKIVPLNKSNFNSLDALEKYFITKFKAKAVGYNKTAGNN